LPMISSGRFSRNLFSLRRLNRGFVDNLKLVRRWCQGQVRPFLRWCVRTLMAIHSLAERRKSWIQICGRTYARQS